MSDVAAPDAPADENVRSPLAHLAGGRPPAPAWFDAALADRPERTTISAAGVEVELLTWGERGRPGILFIHGGMAHADWWSFIAPFFAEDFRCAAISWSGMGRSDWRERYTFPTFVAEMIAGCEAAGLFEAAEKPVVVAHSFGGGVATHAASDVDPPLDLLHAATRSRSEVEQGHFAHDPIQCLAVLQLELASERGLDRATTGEVIAWLKADYDLGHGHAANLAQLIVKGPDVVAAKYAEGGVLHLDGLDAR